MNYLNYRAKCIKERLHKIREFNCYLQLLNQMYEMLKISTRISERPKFPDQVFTIAWKIFTYN